jgi:hypothetical protein
MEELEGARKELEKSQKKSRFSFFGRSKDAAKKKDWETYDEVRPPNNPGMEKDRADPNDPTPKDSNVIFDVDAIRAELAKVDRDEEIIQPKELNSTLPPLKADSSLLNAPMHANLRHTKSFDHHGTAYGLSGMSENRSSLPSLQSSGGYRPFDHGSDDEDEFGHRCNGEIQMTFDPAPPAPCSRPGLRQSVTMPPITATERNVWADDDDDFGQEQEMTMTFA